MYFQGCSNSTYPQDSGERYRTNGPLVVSCISDINKHVLKEHSKAFIDIKNAAAARLEKVRKKGDFSCLHQMLFFC